MFVLGPRQTGKSTFLKTTYPSATYIDLLNSRTHTSYLSNPNLLYKEMSYLASQDASSPKMVIIDEIQKLPVLLDEIHRLIEEYKNLRFILTGSSARKLKKSGVNLLGGRASRVFFNPLVSTEIGFTEFSQNLSKILNYGTLPSVYSSSDPFADLKDYVGLYLKEEIQNEGLVRNLENFSRFLEFSALTNGQQLNFTSLSSDIEIPSRTIREYYYMLVDTLVGSLLPAYEKTQKRKAMTTAKFYFFDTGVTQALMNRTALDPKTPEYGNALEQKIFCEIKAFNDYHGSPFNLYYWRSVSKYEVDFVIENSQGETIGIEVKASAHPKTRDYRGLLALAEEVNLKRKIVVCSAERSYVDKDVHLLSIEDFLRQLWSQRLF